MTPDAASPSSRDAAAPTLAALLLLLSAGVVGLPVPACMPTSPEGFAAAVTLVASAWCGVVVPSLRGARPGAVLACAAVALPFAAFARAAAVAPLAWPVPALTLAFVGGVVAATLPPRPRRAATAAVALGLVLGPLLASIGGVPVPEPLLLPRTALGVEEVSAVGRPASPLDRIPAAWRAGRREDGRRVGALARRPSAAGAEAAEPAFGGLDAPFLPVPEGTPGALPRAGLVLRVLGPRPPLERLGSFALVSGRTLPRSPLELDAIDAIQLPGGVELDPAEADVLARFVRRGGLLVGPLPPSPMPASLRRRLGAGAVPDQAGPAGVHVSGLGHVALAEGAAGLEALAAARLAAPRLSTAFDRALTAPRGLLAFSLPPDDPQARRGALPILLPFVLVMGLLGVVGGRRRDLRVAILALAVAVGLEVLTERAPGGRGAAFRLEVGGAGGRSVEGLVVSAGPAGLVLEGASTDEGGLRALGFEAREAGGSLRWVLPPGGRGVLIRETESTGRTDGLVATDDLPSWALPWIDRGDAPPGAFRLYAGTLPYRGPRPAGVRVEEQARCLSAVPGRP